jgi:hypothetical protein
MENNELSWNSIIRASRPRAGRDGNAQYSLRERANLTFRGQRSKRYILRYDAQPFPFSDFFAKQAVRTLLTIAVDKIVQICRIAGLTPLPQTHFIGLTSLGATGNPYIFQIVDY